MSRPGAPKIAAGLPVLFSRAAPLLGVLLVIRALAVPTVIAQEPTLDPSPTAAVTAEPSPPPTPAVTPSPAPDQTPTPTPTVPEPSPTPAEPSPTPAEPSSTPAEPSPTATPSPSPTPTIAYELSPGQRPGATTDPPFPLWQLVSTSTTPVEPTTPHTVAAGLDDGADCAACHTSHTARAAELLTVPVTEATLCLACHGQGSTFDVESAYTSAPDNDRTTAAFFGHRSPQCADCHNPHDASAQRPAQSTTGWTASGDIRAASGVSADLVPIDRALGGGGSLTYEYELCFKCHSSAGSLPVRDTDHPSWWALDKAIELNPANNSYHPIEAAGRNGTAQMAASLAGTSPYKRWQFSIDSTVRCTNCHADPASLSNDAAGYAPSHASTNRGLLVANYRDRVLKPAGELYQASDFALCYLCHAEAPFANPNTNPLTSPELAAGTLFPLHGDHVKALTPPGGTAGSVDAPGAGQGLALCAECHFRIHSTAIAYQPGDLTPTARASGNTGLVNFAPNVEGVAGSDPAWLAPAGTGAGSCTLTCHGYTHAATSYVTAPGAGFTASTTTAKVGVSVDFIDQSRYADPVVDIWAWTFGDGESSPATNPSHTYSTAGTYTVTLTVTRTADGLSSTLTRTSYIIITSP